MTVKKLHVSHPYLSVVLILFAMMVPIAGGGVIGRLLGWSDLATYATGLGLAAIMASIIVTWLRWWSKIGFRRFKQYLLLWIFVVAIFGDVVNNWEGQIALTAAGIIGLSLLVTVLGAFCEEVFFRGLMLRILEPKGIWLAAIVTSILFGLAHLANVAAGMSLEVVLWQLCYASAYGLAYAAFALRTGTIWPIILTHFLNNFSILLVSGWETQIQEVSAADQWLNIIYTVGFAGYGILLLKKHRKELTSQAA